MLLRQTCACLCWCDVPGSQCIKARGGLQHGDVHCCRIMQWLLVPNGQKATTLQNQVTVGV